MSILWKIIEFYKGKRDYKAIAIAAWDFQGAKVLGVERRLQKEQRQTQFECLSE